MNYTHKIVHLNHIVERVAAIKDLLDGSCKDLFPAGTEVEWIMRGDTVSKGIITRHGYDDDMWAENIKTGCEVKISSYHILQAAKKKGLIS